MLELIEERLKKLKHNDHPLRWVKLTGSTTDRATPVNQFQAGEVPLFLISLKAGGTGLNLTAADTVIHYDPWWNPAVENQATDRAHRIGQDKNVFVYKLITQGTVEEKIVAMQERKRELVDGLLNSDRKTNFQLTADDIDFLFAPLEQIV
jgi:SNF2 family DNA or RNA helicase